MVVMLEDAVADLRILIKKTCPTIVARSTRRFFERLSFANFMFTTFFTFHIHISFIHSPTISIINFLLFYASVASRLVVTGLKYLIEAQV